MHPISSNRTIQDASAILMDHLKARVMSSGEEVLGKALEHIDYDVERLKFTVTNRTIQVSTIYTDIAYRYNREFDKNMILTEYRDVFTDYSVLLADAMVDGVETSAEYLSAISDEWGEDLANYLVEIIDILNSESLTGPFSWQIVGSTKLSIEFFGENVVLIFPLALLHYLHFISTTRSYHERPKYSKKLP